MLNDVAARSYEELRAIRGRVEWHVVLPKSFEHLSFELVSRLHHSVVFLLPAFSLPWLEAIGPIGDSMSSDSLKQLVVETSTSHRTAVALRGDQWLKRLQGLNRPLEADGTRLHVMRIGGLGDDGTDKVVSEDVRPDFLLHQFGRFATQDVHLHRLLERSQIEFGIPAGTIKFCQVAG